MSKTTENGFSFFMEGVKILQEQYLKADNSDIAEINKKAFAIARKVAKTLYLGVPANVYNQMIDFAKVGYREDKKAKNKKAK